MQTWQPRGSTSSGALPDSPVFPVRGGGHGDRHNLGRRIKHIVAIADELRSADGLAPLPKRITPHTFRRTVTLSFQAGKDLVFVQRQVGHADWKTTLGIYTQVSRRTVDPEIRTLLEIFVGDLGPDGSRCPRPAPQASKDRQLTPLSGLTKLRHGQVSLRCDKVSCNCDKSTCLKGAGNSLWDSRSATSRRVDPAWVGAAFVSRRASARPPGRTPIGADGRLRP